MKKRSARKKQIPRSKRMPSMPAFVVISLLLVLSLGFAVRSILLGASEQQVIGVTTHKVPQTPQPK